MPKQIAFVKTLIPTVNSASSDTANFPKENIIVPESPYDYHKTTVTTDSWVIFDFGAPVALTGVALFNTNYTSYQLQGDTTTSFASPATNSGTITLRQDPYRLRYNGYSDPTTYSPAFNYRYLRLFIPSQTPTDGASVFKTGGIAFSSGTNELTFNPDIGFRFTIIRPSDFSLKRGGGAPEIRKVGERFAQINMTTSRYVTVTSQVEEIAEKMISTDEDDTVIFFDNGEWQTYLTDSPFVFCTRRVGYPEMTFDGYPLIKVSNLTFVECL